MILEEQFPVPRNTAVSKIGNGVIHCFDNSNVIATLIMTNYSSFFKGVFLWDDPDQDQWSKITRIMVDNESMNPCPEWINCGGNFSKCLGLWRVVSTQWSWEVLILKNCIESSSYASTTYVVASYGPHFFSNVSEKFGQLARIFGKMVYRPSGKKLPVCLYMKRSRNSLTSWSST